MEHHRYGHRFLRLDKEKFLSVQSIDQYDHSEIGDSI